MKADVASGTTGHRTPRYLELAEDLRSQILGGEFPQPELFPTESVLCARYGVSRFTVREALRTLQNEGLIQRRRGSGTVVQPAAARGGALHQPLSNVGEILQYARDSSIHFERRGNVPLPRKLIEQTGVALPGKWAFFRGIRTRRGDDTPIAASDAYVHPDLAEIADRIDDSGDTIFRQLEQLSPVRISRVTQDIQAVFPGTKIAAALKVAPRTPCLRILRSYYDQDGRIIELSISHHPGRSFAYSMHIDVDK